MHHPPPSLKRECVAEFIGTFLLIFFGTGAVFTGLFTGALSSLYEVAIVWAVVISIAIYATAAVSGAHINPSVTIAFAAWRRFPNRKIAPYVASQIAGAFLASAVLYALFAHFVADFEAARGLTRGAPGSQLSAMAFGCYYPNPDIVGTDAKALSMISLPQAVGAEILGTALLVFFVFALTDPRNPKAPDGNFAGVFIGLGVALIIVCLSPLTMAGLNPARDLGPRLFSWVAGWGSIAFPGPRGGFFVVYTVAPLIGAVLGGFAYDRLLRR